jgi:hypothetical protein
MGEWQRNGNGRAVPRHLLPFDDPRWRPLVVRDLRQLSRGDRRRLDRAFRELLASQWLASERLPKLQAFARRVEIRRALDLPARGPRLKRRSSRRPGRPRKIDPAKIRTLKRLRLSDAQIAEQLGVSRSTIARRKKSRRM